MHRVTVVIPRNYGGGSYVHRFKNLSNLHPRSAPEGQTNVANVEPRVIQQLLAEVESLERALKGVGQMKTNQLKRSKISEVRSAVIGEAAFDANRWSELGADKQGQLLKRLTLIRDELLRVSGTEAGRPSNYFVQDDGVSKRAIIWLAVFGSIFAATLLSLIR